MRERIEEKNDDEEIERVEGPAEETGGEDVALSRR